MNREFFEKYPSYKNYFKNFLGGWSFENGKRTLTIKDVGEQEMYDQETGGKKVEPVIWFEEEQLPMVLNVTNGDAIAKVLGTGDWSRWIGGRIIVGTEKVRAFGKVTMAIRVKDEKPEPAETYICERCGQVIKEGRRLVEQTRADFGQALCIDCARKAKAERDV